MKKIAVILLIIILATNSANASIFTDIMAKIAPHITPTPVIKPATEPITNDFKAFMGEMYRLNTPQGIKNLNAEMTNYDTNLVKVWVVGIPSCPSCAYSFYVVKNMGIVGDYKPQGRDTTDKKIVLTYNQVMKMYPYFEDGKIDFFDRWQLYAIYKMG